MSDRERAKAWIDEMSSNNLDRILYFMNLILTKEELITEKCNLKKEKQQLISFLEDKIKEYDGLMRIFEKNGINNELEFYKKETFQEVLDFVNKSGKDE